LPPDLIIIAPNSILAQTLPHTLLWSLQCSSRPCGWNLGDRFPGEGKGEKKKEREESEEMGKGEGKVCKGKEARLPNLYFWLPAGLMIQSALILNVILLVILLVS